MNSDMHRPRFHFTAPSHWINDPNGLCFHGGRYHLYYQYNPNANQWGDIHWGHTSSADLVTWRDEPLALAPTPGSPDAGGCFSGSFALVDGQPTLYYTGFTPERQVQCTATSADLQRWTLQPERTLYTPPEGVEPHDFRDPYVFQHAGYWYMVVGASLRHERGQALLYRSEDGIAWDYRGPLYTAATLASGRMWECPNFFPLGDKWVLTVSIWLGLGVHWFVGRFENEVFIPESEGVLDPEAGSFAHLTMQGPDGRALQWAWMNEQREQERIDADGWAGAMTVPRVLSLDPRGRLNLRPVAEIATLRQAPIAIHTTGATRGVLRTFAGRHLDIEATFTMRRVRDQHKLGLTLLAAPDGSEATRIVFWPDARRLSIERGRSSTDSKVRRQDVCTQLDLDPGEDLHLRVLLDASVLEVYANDRLCLATRVYPQAEDSVEGSAFADGDVDLVLQAWSMGSIYAEPRTAVA
ncbi:sucrose-6-phosphate hydrolase [Comamonadaceae bacterium OS-1]|nr:sucrose-6-phosphate hydrolase [Comamonadaceae bacterium OS-1]